MFPHRTIDLAINLS